MNTQGAGCTRSCLEDEGCQGQYWRPAGEESSGSEEVEVQKPVQAAASGSSDSEAEWRSRGEYTGPSAGCTAVSTLPCLLRGLSVQLQSQ